MVACAFCAFAGPWATIRAVHAGDATYWQELLGRHEPLRVELPLLPYRAGKERLLGFFIGQVMRETNGKADPKLVNELPRAKL